MDSRCTKAYSGVVCNSMHKNAKNYFERSNAIKVFRTLLKACLQLLYAICYMLLIAYTLSLAAPKAAKLTDRALPAASCHLD